MVSFKHFLSEFYWPIQGETSLRGAVVSAFHSLFNQLQKKFPVGFRSLRDIAVSCLLNINEENKNNIISTNKITTAPSAHFPTYICNKYTVYAFKQLNVNKTCNQTTVKNIYSFFRGKKQQKFSPPALLPL